MHWYTAYGLTWESDMPLPELTETDPGEADVRVVLRTVQERIEDPKVERPIWAAADGEWLQTVRDVGRYHVSNGSEIAIEQWGSDRDVRAYLFGSAIGALLHQRRILTLHASSVLHGERALLVAGDAGAGKSTTLAALIHRGHTMITDDKTVVVADGERLLTIPGHPTVRLWEDALDAAGRPTDGLERLLDNGKKFLWRAPEIHDADVELGRIFLLRKGPVDEVAVERLEGHAAFRAVLAATYRRPMVAGMGVGDIHFSIAARVADAVPVFRITRPAEAQSVDAVVDTILETP